MAVALSTLAACGGDDVTSPTYPDVVGTYDVGVAFNGVALVGAGTRTITTSKLGVLTGDADLVITGGAQPVRQTGVVSGTMTRLGFVQFGLAPSGPMSQWNFGGQRASDGTFFGTHSILLSACTSCAAAPRTGTWTATRR